MTQQQDTFTIKLTPSPDGYANSLLLILESGDAPAKAWARDEVRKLIRQAFPNWDEAAGDYTPATRIFAFTGEELETIRCAVDITTDRVADDLDAYAYDTVQEHEEGKEYHADLCRLLPKLGQAEPSQF